MLDLQYWGYVVKIMTSPQNFYEAERPLMGTNQLWVPIGPTIQAGIEIAQSQVFFYQSSSDTLWKQIPTGWSRIFYLAH